MGVILNLAVWFGLHVLFALGIGPRPYQLVVLSDHGQTQGEAFTARFGESLPQLVGRLCGGPLALREQAIALGGIAAFTGDR